MNTQVGFNEKRGMPVRHVKSVRISTSLLSGPGKLAQKTLAFLFFAQKYEHNPSTPGSLLPFTIFYTSDNVLKPTVSRESFLKPLDQEMVRYNISLYFK